ncbi:MAG: thioredoxin domain-containing protein [Acidobacteria bacterium]|nr:thioredoxin domain-containing protein [Acidobacteriota bacterium]
MKTHARTLIVALATLALATSVASLYVHYQMLADPTYTSFCDVSETVSCEAVLTSRYGSVFGVPVAVGGAVWSALVLLLGVVGMRPRMRPSILAQGAPRKVEGRPPRSAPQSEAADAAGRVAGYIFVLSTIGLAGVLYLGYASFFILRQMCPLCVTMYVAVVGLFIVSGAAASGLAALPARLGGDLRAALTSPSPLAATLVVVWAVASVSLVAFFPREEAPADVASEPLAPPTETLGADEVAQFTAWLDAQPRVELGLPATGARVVVAKFNDYQCPACRQAHLAYKGIQQKYESAYPGQVAFLSLDYPLEAECNTGGIHSAACEAAVAVRLARAKNRGPEMEEWLFANQNSLTRDRVKEGLTEIAQVGDFDARYAETLGAVRADAQLGQKLKITGTPTFFINGIRIESTLRPAYFDATIAHELKRAQAATP